VRLKGDILYDAIDGRMDRGGDESVRLTDDLACGYRVAFGDCGFAGGADMLTEKNMKGFGGGQLPDGAVLGKVLVFLRMDAAWKCYSAFSCYHFAPFADKKIRED
jgi:hypothetical protein